MSSRFAIAGRHLVRRPDLPITSARTRVRNRRLLALLAMLAAGASAADATLDPLAMAGASDGLVVEIGCGDGARLLALSDRERRLVQGLCLSDADLTVARQRIAQAGAGGWVSVRRVDDFRRLPYVANLVDLVMADLDALGAAAPPDAELLRIVAPGCVLLTKRGSWQRTVKPQPSGVDGWTHEFHSAEGNPYSRDLVAGPSFDLQWLAGYQGAKQGMGGQHLRIAGGRVVAFRSAPGLRPRMAQHFLECRQAWNGRLLWRREMTVPAQPYNPLVATATRVVTALDGPLVALDAATGATRATLDEVGAVAAQPFDRSNEVATAAGLLVATGQGRVIAYDLESGGLRWSWTPAAGGRPFLPRLDRNGERVFVLLAEDPKGTGAGDHGWRGVTRATAVVCLDAAKGSERWRHAGPDTAGVGIANLVLHPLHGLFVQGFGHGVFREQVRLLRLDAATGAVLGDFRDAEHESAPALRGLRTLAVDDHGLIWMRGGREIRRLDPASGARTWQARSDSSAKCFGGSLTPRFIFDGHHWYDPARPAAAAFAVATHAPLRCTQRVYPALGMLFLVEGIQCQCYAFVRGLRALSGERPGPAVPDAARLRTGPGRGQPRQALESPAVVQEPPYLWELDPTMQQRPVQAVSFQPRPIEVRGPLIASDWVSTDAFATTGTLTVAAGDLLVSVDIHRHLLSATRGGRAAWTFQAGGRVSSPPVVHRGVVVFGCHDGHVYALDAASGLLAWSHLAAWNHQQIVAYGQVESQWPVFGVVARDGRIFASAGRHPQLSHGIQVCCLDVVTGDLVWASRVAQHPETLWGKSNTSGRQDSMVVNVPPAIRDDQLKIGGHVRFDLATGMLIDPSGQFTSSLPP